MYPYHNKIKSRIKKGELIYWEYCENYNKVGECILLHFNTVPFVRPIRPHRYVEYMGVLEGYPQGGIK